MLDITRILSQIEAGDTGAAERLMPLVYDELRRLAAANLAREKPGQTLQATALVHEAYLRLIGTGQEQNWHSRGHFFAAAAEAMRRILVEKARRKRRVKHGGDRRRIELVDFPIATRYDVATLLAVDEALDELAREEPAAAQLVKLHVFLGMTLDEAGSVLGVSRATVYRQWAYARAWLKVALADDVDQPVNDATPGKHS
jgi:RNA polymerase sigma factor (TIGR02999 family)